LAGRTYQYAPASRLVSEVRRVGAGGLTLTSARVGVVAGTRTRCNAKHLVGIAEGQRVNWARRYLKA